MQRFWFNRIIAIVSTSSTSIQMHKPLITIMLGTLGGLCMLQRAREQIAKIWCALNRNGWKWTQLLDSLAKNKSRRLLLCGFLYLTEPLNPKMGRVLRFTVRIFLSVKLHPVKIFPLLKRSTSVDLSCYPQGFYGRALCSWGGGYVCQTCKSH